MDTNTPYAQYRVKRHAHVIKGFHELRDDEYITPAAAAGVCSIGLSTLWLRIAEGKIPPGVKDGSKRLLRVGDVRAYLAQRKAAGVPGIYGNNKKKVTA